MRRLRVTIVDLVTKGPSRALWGRVMQPNFASSADLLATVRLYDDVDRPRPPS